MKPIDREAIERAIAMACRDPECERQIGEMRGRGYFGEGMIGDLAVYHCQFRAIRPKLWQELPMDVEPGNIERTLAAGPDVRSHRQLCRRAAAQEDARRWPQQVRAGSDCRAAGLGGEEARGEAALQ